MQEKKLIWVGRAKEELLDLPKEIRSEFGYALGLAQLGDAHPHATPMKRQLRERIEPRWKIAKQIHEASKLDD